jgi:hypothetical protein
MRLNQIHARSKVTASTRQLIAVKRWMDCSNFLCATDKACPRQVFGHILIIEQNHCSTSCAGKRMARSDQLNETCGSHELVSTQIESVARISEWILLLKQGVEAASIELLGVPRKWHNPTTTNQ